MSFPNTTFTTGTTITSNWLNAVNDKCMEIISVADFGAVGDGVTDDTAAIQAAINACSNNFGRVVFPYATYITRTLIPKSNVEIDLQGSTLKLANGTYSQIFDGTSGGSNFSIINGILDGNQANNAANVWISGMTAFTNWTNINIQSLEIKNVFTAAIVFAGTTTNINISNVLIHDCGQANVWGKFSYGLQLNSGVSNLTINNFSVIDTYGYGIHFYACTDFVANNLVFDNLNYGTSSIAITWTQAKRGKVTNILCNNVVGDNLEINASVDQIIENVTINNAGNRPLLMGDNGSGIFNERVKVSQFKCTNTGAAFSLVLNYIKRCKFEFFDCDKSMDTTVAGLAANDRNNVFSDCVFTTNIRLSFTYYRKFHLVRVSFANFYVNNFDGAVATFGNPQINGSFNITVANGATTYINFNDFNTMGGAGFVTGRLKVTSFLNNNQSTHQECLFLASNNNTTMNLSTITTLNNAVARPVVISTDAANRQIILTNSSGVDLNVLWTVELHKADY